MNVGRTLLFPTHLRQQCTYRPTASHRRLSPHNVANPSNFFTFHHHPHFPMHIHPKKQMNNNLLRIYPFPRPLRTFLHVSCVCRVHVHTYKFLWSNDFNLQLFRETNHKTEPLNQNS